MNLSNNFFVVEKEFKNKGFEQIIGVDEVGRGPLCGPVVAAAVCLCGNFSDLVVADFADKNWQLVRDSKKLSENQREKIFDFILENFHVGIGLCDHKTIDRINILEASFLAMKKALGDLDKKFKIVQKKKIVLVDGNKKIPNFSVEQLAIVGGDKKIKSISAASVVAKVIRDRMMKDFDQKYPKYGFAKHKGYGTKFHLEALKKYGPCEIHRRSFGPVKNNPKIQ